MMLAHAGQSHWQELGFFLAAALVAFIAYRTRHK